MKKFVFASGYLSTVCLIAGVVVIALSFFRRESAQMDREKNQKTTEMILFQTDHASTEAGNAYRDFELMQAQRDLEALEEANSLFSLGQTLLVLAVGVFSITILPYYFYSRYQRDALLLQQV